jgi:tetratricopeptide (TPR) repeat protein
MLVSRPQGGYLTPNNERQSDALNRTGIQRLSRHLKKLRHASLSISVLALVSTARPGTAQQNPSPSADSGSGISVENSAQLFSVMCALDAAGFDAENSTLQALPAAAALHGQLLELQGPAVDALRQFYRDHELGDPGETLSRYISFALVTGPPPKFPFSMEHDLLPPDVLALEGFQDMLVTFYREAHLQERWDSVAAEYEREIARAQGPVRQVLLVSSGYLREIIRPIGRRTFTVYIEPLVGSRTNFRNYGDHYGIVLGGGRNLPLDEIRHAYLHFLLDPLLLRNRQLVETKRALLNAAARAPRLPVEYQTDFVALMDECFVKAVELRLRRLNPQKLEAAMREEDLNGYVLVRPLIQQLQKFEKAEPAMSLYFPDLVSGIDVLAEQKRLQNFAFSPAGAVVPKAEATATAEQPSELGQWLAEGDHEIALQDAEAATKTFERVLAKYPGQPQALYGLAIASVLAGKADRAKELFERLVSTPDSDAVKDKDKVATGADPTIVAWSHVYLGRIHDLEDERDLAITEYHAAMNVEGAPEAARLAAQRGTQAAYRPSSNRRESSPQKP